MPAKSTKKRSALWGFSPESLLLRQLRSEAPPEGRRAVVHVQTGKKAKSAVRVIDGEKQVEIFLAPLLPAEIENDPRLKSPAAVRVRDAVGASVAQLEKLEVVWVEYRFELDPATLEAALLGLEVALYRFKRIFKDEPIKLGFHLCNRGRSIPEKILTRTLASGVAVNLARHLVNLPPNLLNPRTYAQAIEALFKGAKNVRIEVWDETKLLKERMNLLLAVGQASHTAPRLVHIRYRPSGAKKAPVALVGKGITFDSGGLDIKPSSGMRLMKKDMGGSAVVLGLAHWAVTSQLPLAMDFYLPLAENAIGGNGFRPSDILIARNGQSVEIHNTDAEGRLVLADAMDVAITQSEKPRYLIDIATLTGAIKVALGSALAGLFSNDSRLAQSLSVAGQRAGDFTWIMPLMQKYRVQLNSTFADQVNAVDGFGGAVTAALFLEKFAGNIPWAHFDIYAWKDSAEGAWLEAGGSGQSVLGLAQWLQTLR